MYCNMYINNLLLGCLYKNQGVINNLCPEHLKNTDVNNIIVPEYF